VLRAACTLRLTLVVVRTAYRTSLAGLLLAFALLVSAAGAEGRAHLLSRPRAGFATSLPQGNPNRGNTLETFRRYILSAPPERLAGSQGSLLGGTKIVELLGAARSGKLTQQDVATFAQSVSPSLLATFEQGAGLPSGFFLTTTREVQFPGGNPFLARTAPGAAKQRRWKAEIAGRLEEITTLHFARGGRSLPSAIQLLTSTSHLTAPARLTAHGLSAAIREAVDRIPILELEKRHNLIMSLPAEQALTQMPSRRSLDERKDLINFDHLLKVLGKQRQGKLLVDVYAENMPASGRVARYLPVAALGEGSYCVDDIARTTVALLQAQRQGPRADLLRQARAGLRFVAMMQAPDGEFYNFATLQGGRIEVNRGGSTSKKGIDYWAVRALWALGEGYATLPASDPAARQAARAIERSLPRIEAPLARYGTYRMSEGKRSPAWLINDAADQTAVAVKGLVSFYGALAPGRTRERVAEIIRKFSDGIAQAQVKDPGAPDLGRFYNGVAVPSDKHLWGSHQVEALALAGKALGRPDWIRSAALCADHYWRRATPASIIVPGEDEIAYGVETVVSGFARLYEATGKKQYAKATARWASWFFGNNGARAVMYDTASGRGYDGIAHVEVRGKKRYSVNSNSGAESTVEAILALQSAALIPGVHAKLRADLGRELPR
jgi:hypothetical protein